VLDQFKNRVSVVLCHAKVSRASGGSASPEDDNDSGIAEGANIRQPNRILPMR
jgi:hypothetical protein